MMASEPTLSYIEMCVSVYLLMGSVGSILTLIDESQKTKAIRSDNIA